MKFKFVQTRLVRYSVVIDSPDMDTAYDKVFHHEEWCEEGVEEEDPPWSEECPEDADPDVYIVGGWVLDPSEYGDPPKSAYDCEGNFYQTGARVMYQRGTWDGAPWFPGTVTFMYRDPLNWDNLSVLIEDDDKTIKFLKHGTWVDSKHIKVGVPEVVPVPEVAVPAYGAWEAHEWDDDEELPVEDDIEEEE
jgi:hypothetical protein